MKAENTNQAKADLGSGTKASKATQARGGSAPCSTSHLLNREGWLNRKRLEAIIKLRTSPVTEHFIRLEHTLQRGHMGTADLEEAPKFYIVESNQTLPINSDRSSQ